MEGFVLNLYLSVSKKSCLTQSFFHFPLTLLYNMPTMTPTFAMTLICHETFQHFLLPQSAKLHQQFCQTKNKSPCDVTIRACPQICLTNSINTNSVLGNTALRIKYIFLRMTNKHELRLWLCHCLLNVSNHFDLSGKLSNFLLV